MVCSLRLNTRAVAWLLKPSATRSQDLYFAGRKQLPSVGVQPTQGKNLRELQKSHRMQFLIANPVLREAAKRRIHDHGPWSTVAAAVEGVYLQTGDGIPWHELAGRRMGAATARANH